MADATDDDPDPADGESASDAIPSAVDEKQQSEQKIARRSYLAKREAFWKAVLSDPVGRQEIWAWLGIEAHAFETKFACGPNGFPQSEATWAAHGEQMLGQRLFQTLQQIDFEGCWLMLTEHDGRFKKPPKGRK
jgi:hypothetical protein